MISTAPSPLAPMLRKLQLWTQLDDAERAAVLALPYKVSSIQSGTYIVRDG